MLPPMFDTQILNRLCDSSSDRWAHHQVDMTDIDELAIMQDGVGLEAFAVFIEELVGALFIWLRGLLNVPRWPWPQKRQPRLQQE
jgi:hypothetical protein